MKAFEGSSIFYKGLRRSATCEKLQSTLKTQFATAKTAERILSWRMRFVFVGTALAILILSIPSMLFNVLDITGVFGALIVISPLIACVAIRPTEAKAVTVFTWVLLTLIALGCVLFIPELPDLYSGQACPVPTTTNATSNATGATNPTVCIIGASARSASLALVLVCLALALPTLPRWHRVFKTKKMSTRVRLYRVFTVGNLFVGVDGALQTVRYLASGLVEPQLRETRAWAAELAGGLMQLVVATYLSNPHQIWNLWDSLEMAVISGGGAASAPAKL